MKNNPTPMQIKPQKTLEKEIFKFYFLTISFMYLTDKSSALFYKKTQ